MLRSGRRTLRERCFRKVGQPTRVKLRGLPAGKGEVSIDRMLAPPGMGSDDNQGFTAVGDGGLTGSTHELSFRSGNTTFHSNQWGGYASTMVRQKIQTVATLLTWPLLVVCFAAIYCVRALSKLRLTWMGGDYV